MPSSTSNSNYARALWIALAVAAGFLVALEMATQIGFQRVSRVESRTAQEYKQALAIRPAAAGQPPNVLIAGNSLLLAGVDESINRLVTPEARVYRLVVEQTSYFDWYYGLRRLLAEGARPDYLVLCIGPTHWVSNSIRGDYSSYYLFQASDIPAVASSTGYGLTQEAGLFTAHYSLFFAGRGNLRQFLLNRLYPGYSGVLHDLTTHPAPDFPPDEVEPKVEGRMRELKAVAGNRTRLAVAMPPTFVNYEAGIGQAAERAGVPLLVPVHAGQLPEDLFIDGMHVSEAGARKFMAELAPELKALVRSTAK